MMMMSDGNKIVFKLNVNITIKYTISIAFTEVTLSKVLQEIS